MCGASPKPMMMSGPAPLFEVTAVCWLMSSQPTKSTLTATPVLSVNLAALARNTSSSACTKRTGRNMRNVAPFSIGREGAGTSAALTLEASWAEAPVAASAAMETPSANASRRVMSLIASPSLCSSPGVFAVAFIYRLCMRFPDNSNCTLCEGRPLAVGPAVHADRLPAAKLGVLQHGRVDAAYRPQALEHE